mmetsp:Transcript_120553/g.336355  ORF Transcript_120553/g.336355 Transcript_120553/m.336355 type:complete len:614 (-) Transcript_120553:90-1931(-)
MPELDAVLAEQFTQVQEVFTSHYKQTLSVASEQKQLIAQLRKENQELRAKLGIAAPSRARGSSSQNEVDVVAEQLAEAEWAASDSCSLVHLPGTVVRQVDTGTRWSSARSSTMAPEGQAAPQKLDKDLTPILPSPLRSRAPTRELVSLLLSRTSHTSAAESEDLRKARAVFADAASMKERVRAAILKPEYDVRNCYKQTGICQRIARSGTFDTVTLIVIAVNAIWIAVDSDWNTASVIFEASWPFQLVEHSFFLFFFAEWLIRFMAFQRKRDGFRDLWFIFDTCLVVIMVAESWVMSAVIIWAGGLESASMDTFSVIRILKLLRLTRMMRMARLLRAAPELMILIKGIAAAFRSVGFTLLLLLGIVYIFAVAFRTLTDGTPLGSRLFPNVPLAASTLLLEGTLPDLAPIVTDVSGEQPLMGLLFVFFILLGYLTVMNMLVGVLVEVVCTVSSVEKEQMEAQFLKVHMLHLLRGLEDDGDLCISRDEFGKLLEKPKAIKALQEVGVDVVGLAELSDFIYKERTELTFPDFMETVLQLRGKNVATVKSIVDMRMFITKELSRVEDNLLDKLHSVILIDLFRAMGLGPGQTPVVQGGLPGLGWRGSQASTEGDKPG